MSSSTESQFLSVPEAGRILGVQHYGRRVSDSPLLKISEAAEILGVSREHAYRMARDGVLPVVRHTPGGLRVPLAAFDAWLEAQSRQALANVKSPRDTP